MKTAYFFLVLALLFIIFGDIHRAIRLGDLEQRVERLEELIKQERNNENDKQAGNQSAEGRYTKVGKNSVEGRPR